MNLAQFFRLVTAMKTAATHMGIDAKDATVSIHSIDDNPSAIIVRGTGRDGTIETVYNID